jgi:aquaporin Z
MPNLVRRSLAEAAGTFFVVLLGAGSIMVSNVTNNEHIGTVGVGFAFAFTLAALVYAFGRVSGAHVNPAVTVALWTRRRFPGRDLLAYVVAQCAGAILASAILRWIVGPVADLGATVPVMPPLQSFTVEFLMSFFVLLTILGVATQPGGGGGGGGIAIGLAYGVGTLIAAPFTRASLNPARSFGPAVVGGDWYAHWIFWLAPIAGMVAAAWFYDFVRPASAVPPGVPLGLQGPLEKI